MGQGGGRLGAPPTPKRNLHVYLLPLLSFYFSIKTLSVFLLSPGIIFLVLFHLMAPLSEKYSGGGGGSLPILTEHVQRLFTLLGFGRSLGERGKF